MFGLLRTHHLTAVDSTVEEGGIRTLRFRADAPITWRAGQHGLLRLGGAKVKPFSIASAPEEGDILIGTSLSSGSAYKRALVALNPGSRVTLHGPVMNFTLDEAGSDVIMLAQGVGITPFRAMLRHLAITGGDTHSVLIHVASSGHPYGRTTAGDATQAHYPQSGEQFRRLLSNATADHPEAHYLIAGSTSFVTATAALLVGAGIPRPHIRRDAYYGLRPDTAPSPATPANPRER